VASTRLIFNEIDDQMEHEQFVTFPIEFPRKDEICEITRVCTHPDFRGSDLLLGLFRFAAITVVQSGRRFVVGCATPDLLPLYTRLGFQATPLRYKHKSLNNIEHVIFVSDISKGLAGQGVSPFIWNVVWRDVIEYVIERQLIELDPMANIRMGLYRMVGPLAKFLYRKAKRPHKSKSELKLAIPASTG
jgi:hypothetical protein